MQIYQEMTYLVYPILRGEVARVSQIFKHPLLTSEHATLIQDAQILIPPIYQVFSCQIRSS